MSKKSIIIVSIWAFCSIITFLSGGGFATRAILNLSEDVFIPYKEELHEIQSINLLKTNNGYLVSICFNATLAYTTENKNYQIDKYFKADFTGWGTEIFPRKNIKLGCNKTKGTIDLLSNALSDKTDNINPYYKLGGIYCIPGENTAALNLGCFMNPKQKWGRVEISLDRPEYKYKDNSQHRIWLPAAWVIDILLAPIFIGYVLFQYTAYFIWAIGGGGGAGLP